MTRMTGPDCVVMCNLINTYIPPREDQCEWHRMTRMTGPDCVVMCNLINTYIHTYIRIRTYIHTYVHTYIQIHTCVLCKTDGLCFTLGPTACGGFFV